MLHASPLSSGLTARRWFSWPAFCAGGLVNVVGIPLILAWGFVSMMNDAFSPNRHGDPRSTPLVASVWFGGMFLTKYILDHTIFDGPMPEPPSNGFTAGMRAENPELAKKWDHYTEERIKREGPYKLSWIASPLLMGIVFGFSWPILRRTAKPKRESISEPSPPEKW